MTDENENITLSGSYGRRKTDFCLKRTLGRVWTAWVGTKALVTGMFVVLGEAFQPKKTVQYPEAKPFTGRRWRGIHGLFFTSDTTEELCVSCHLCARICPSVCIDMDGHINEDGTKILHKFDIDLARCIYCGYCEEVCPVDAIRLTTSSDYTARLRENLILRKDDLLAIGKAAQQRHEEGALGIRRHDDTATLPTKQGIGTKPFAQRLARDEIYGADKSR